MYVGMMYQFYREAKGDVSCAIDSYLRANEDNPEEAGRRVYYLLLHGLFSNPMKVWLNANRAQIEQDCPGAVDQYMVFWEEAAGDYLGFSGLDIRVDGYGGFTAPYATDSAEYYRKNVRRLNWMQQQLLRTAPKWSKVEGMVRARSSGAHKIDAFMTEMPSTQGSLSNVCLRGTGHLSGAIRSGGELAREITANKNQHARRSDAESKFTSAYPGNLAAGLNHMGGTGCNSLQANFGAGFGGMLRPFIPTRTEAQDYVHTGRETPLESYRDDHFEFIGEDLGHPEVKEYEGASCGEIVDLAPDFRGFRASWAPRIAPVAKCRPANAGWWK
jgi:hypothetical protein